MVQHRLAALWFADIVGYTGHSHEDEAGAIAVVQAFQRMARSAVERLGGRLVKFTGDGAVAEFPSTEAAVLAACALQAEFQRRTEDEGLGRRQLRVGVHVGDIATLPDGDVYGDGVNATARIMALAEPGQVLTSEDVVHQLQQRKHFTFLPQGYRELRGIGEIALHAVTVDPTAVERWTDEDTPVPEEVAPSPWPRRQLLAGGIAILLLTVGLAVWEPWTPAMPELSASSLAVLPFNVRGARELEYLDDGMVSLLATKLDGAEGLRSIDSHAILKFVRQRSSSGVVDPGLGRQVAEQFGAGMFVLGNVVQAGNRLHIDATLYPSQGNHAPVQVSVEGDVNRLMELVDQLAAQLIATQVDQPASRLASLAAITTDSLNALKAYLEGERALRSGDLAAALEDYQRAVAIDETFALAHYRLGIVASWIPDYGILEKAVESALEHSDRLSPSDRILVRAFHAHERNRRAEAVGLLRPYLESHPADAEAWYLYAEAVFHGNESIGRSMTQAKEAFEKVLELDPDLFQVVVKHLIEIEAVEGDFAGVDSLLRGIDPESRAAREWRAVRAFALGTANDQQRILADLREMEDGDVIGTVTTLGGFSPGARGAKPAARVLVQPGRAPYTQRIGRLLLITLNLQAGRWHAARAEVDSLTMLDRTRAARGFEFQGLYAAVSEIVPSDAEAREVLGELVQWDPNRVSEWTEGEVRPLGFTPLYQSYLIGLVGLRVRDRASVAEAKNALESWSEEKGEIGDLGRYLGGLLEAHREFRRGRFEEALAGFARPAPELPVGEVNNSPVLRTPYESLLHGDILREADRVDEAVDRYRVLTEATSWLNYPFAPLAHLRLAEIYQDRGEAIEAIRHYTQFVDYWREADEPLRPLVVQAEGRLEALVQETATG